MYSTCLRLLPDELCLLAGKFILSTKEYVDLVYTEYTKPAGRVQDLAECVGEDRDAFVYVYEAMT